jgi:hypothetical protein
MLGLYVRGEAEMAGSTAAADHDATDPNRTWSLNSRIEIYRTCDPGTPPLLWPQITTPICLMSDIEVRSTLGRRADRHPGKLFYLAWMAAAS